MTTTFAPAPIDTTADLHQDRRSHASPGVAAYRKTATTVGVIYLAGMVVGIGGNIVIQSILGTPDALASLESNSMLLAIGAVLWLLAVAGDAAHGVLMFPVLNRHR